MVISVFGLGVGRDVLCLSSGLGVCGWFSCRRVF